MIVFGVRKCNWDGGDTFALFKTKESAIKRLLEEVEKYNKELEAMHKWDTKESGIEEELILVKEIEENSFSDGDTDFYIVEEKVYE